MEKPKRISNNIKNNRAQFWCNLKGGCRPVWRPKNSVISELENVDLYISGDSINSQSQPPKQKINSPDYDEKLGVMSPAQRLRMKHENTSIESVTDFRYKNPLSTPWSMQKSPEARKQESTTVEKYESPQQKAIVLEYMNTLVEKRSSSLKLTSVSTPRYHGRTRHFNLTGLSDKLYFPSSPKLGATNTRCILNCCSGKRQGSQQTKRNVSMKKDVKLKPLLGNVSRASDLDAELNDDVCD